MSGKKNPAKPVVIGAKEAEEYFVKHDLQPLLTDLLVHVGRTHPTKPIKAMIKFLTEAAKQRNESLSSSESGSDSDSDAITETSRATPLLASPEKQSYSRRRRDNVFSEPIDDTEDWVPPVFVKSEEEKEFIRKSIKKNLLFTNIEHGEEEMLINAFEQKLYKKDQVIIRQGEEGNLWYILSDGECTCYIQNPKWTNETNDHKEYGKQVKVYNTKGDTFGELALMYNAPRAATIVCQSSEAKLWALDRVTFRKIVALCSKRDYKMQLSFLDRFEMLSSLDKDEKNKVIEALKPIYYEKGDRIINEGDTGEELYLMDIGICQAVRKEGESEKECYRPYVSGDYFGELALLNNSKRAASVIAVSPSVRLFVLHKDDFERLLGPIVPILQRNKHVYEKYSAIIEKK